MITGQWQLTGDGITGWARSDGFARPVWVELLADGEAVGLARADLPMPDNCGFWLPVAPALLEDDCELVVAAANTGEIIARADENAPDNGENSSSVLQGELQSDGGLTIRGWAVDPDDRDRELRVIAYVNGLEAASAVAGARQYKPLQADRHAFRITLPESFADGETHIVELKDSAGRPLSGSPLHVKVYPQQLSEWLKNNKKPTPAALQVAADALELMERRLPGASSQSNYQTWKKAFPVLPSQTRQKAVISLMGTAQALLKNQQGGEFRFRDDQAEYVLLHGGAASFNNFALAHMLGELRRLDADIAYADAESPDGTPLFKPAWDREAFLAQDYLGPMLISGRLLQKAGIERNDAPEVVRFKAAMAAGSKKIIHLPQLLSCHALTEASPDREACVRQWLSDAYPGASYENGRPGYALGRKPRVSILIPTRDHGDLLNTCLESLRRTDYPEYEIIIIDNGSVADDALAVLARAETEANICVLRRPGVFNYADLNNDGARRATGDLICFLNNDTEVINPDWLGEMAAILLMSGANAGCAGAKLLWPNDLVQHGGVIVGIHQLAGHVGNQWLADDPGYMNRNQFAQRYSAVTAACLLTPRDLFLDMGGFDARRFPVAFNDVDYCLRLGAAGKYVFWTPHAQLRHHESASRGRDMLDSANARARREAVLFRNIWGLYDDPFYNPNLPLSVATEPFMGLAFPPRPRKTRQEQ